MHGKDVDISSLPKEQQYNPPEWGWLNYNSDSLSI